MGFVFVPDMRGAGRGATPPTTPMTNLSPCPDWSNTMGNKSVVKKKKKLKKQACDILEEISLGEPSHELAEKLSCLCDTCRSTYCKQPFESKDQILANACKKWCLGMCSAYILVQEQVVRQDQELFMHMYGCDEL